MTNKTQNNVNSTKNGNRSESSKKSIETREKNNPQELQEARRKGGEHSHGGGRSS